MDKVKELKAEVYDLISQYEQANSFATNIKQQIDAKNLEISKLLSEQQEPTKED